MAGGGAALSLLAVAVEPDATHALRGAWGTQAWLGWLFLVLFGSLVAYTIYLRLLRDWGPVRAGSYAFVSPVIAVLVGVVVLHERFTLLDGLGSRPCWHARGCACRPPGQSLHPRKGDGMSDYELISSKGCG